MQILDSCGCIIIINGKQFCASLCHWLVAGPCHSVSRFSFHDDLEGHATGAEPSGRITEPTEAEGSPKSSRLWVGGQSGNLGQDIFMKPSTQQLIDYRTDLIQASSNTSAIHKGTPKSNLAVHTIS